MTKPLLPGTVVFDVIRTVGGFDAFSTPVALFTERANAERFLEDQPSNGTFQYSIRERTLDQVPARTT